jgi:hypothetical protein
VEATDFGAGMQGREERGFSVGQMIRVVANEKGTKDLEKINNENIFQVLFLH